MRRLGQVSAQWAGQRDAEWRWDVRDPDGNFVKGATVQVVSSKGVVLWTTTTDTAGNAKVDLAAASTIVEKQDGDNGVVGWIDHYVVTGPDGSTATGKIGQGPAPGYTNEEWQTKFDPNWMRVIPVTLTPAIKTAEPAGASLSSGTILLVVGALGLAGWALYRAYR